MLGKWGGGTLNRVEQFQKLPGTELVKLSDTREIF